MLLVFKSRHHFLVDLVISRTLLINMVVIIICQFHVLLCKAENESERHSFRTIRLVHVRVLCSCYYTNEHRLLPF